MYGDPVDYESVKDEDVAKEHGAHVLMHKWKPTSQDFVDEGAIPGSRAVQIAASKEKDLFEDPQSQSELGGSKVTLTEILQALKEHKTIALSDFLAVPCFKVAFDEHVRVELEKRESELSRDDKFAAEVLNSCSDEVISKSARLDKVVNSRVETMRVQLEKNISDIAKIADANDIQLNERQMLMIKQNVKGDESEDQLLELIKAGSHFDKGIGLTDGVFTSPEQVDDKSPVKLANEKFGASLEIVPQEKAKIVI
jgi:hypothetical protein